jgi:hypothetical protein
MDSSPYLNFIDIKYISGSNWVATTTNNEFLYSTNDGFNWTAISLADTPGRINVYSTTEPGAPSLTISGNVAVSGLLSIFAVGLYDLTLNGINSYLTVSSNILKYTNINSGDETIIAGTRQFQPQFITFS